jgi:hypothetical protein
VEEDVLALFLEGEGFQELLYLVVVLGGEVVAGVAVELVGALEEVVLEHKEGGEGGDVEVLHHALGQVAQEAQLSGRVATSKRRK